ncbi:double-transmembrane region domain protein (plasmid) [Gemmatirosa kalamazoonensis]|uniref:Double-transmembrane region domain protein n=1 Tax=Gemmatirosa kalamazoonensis TaxID=861299 RepID=W0RQL7_9BACT|nr:BatA domain-containing protein [Gemmatirosa kalamazoonensis]AHG92747.1 double-transmembrane region domain protein [Gemmatirosa kalamazoonensis]
MPLGFLAPFFLAGLALIAVPVLVHLTRRDRATPTAFPSLMFVRRLPQPTTKRRRLRDPLLLLLRVLALALLAFAFARPLLDRARRGVLPGAGGRELVVLLDRSYSMGTPGRWDRAQDAARRALATLGPADRASVVLFDAGPAVAAEHVGAAAARAAVDSAHVGNGPTRYAPALARAAQILAASPLPRREALLVSDFQRAGWHASAAARLPDGARLTWADVGGAAPSDVAVAGVDLRRETTPEGERVRPVARVVLPNGGAPRTVPVSLAVNGRPTQTIAARVAPGGAASVTFDPIPVPPGWSSGTVMLPTDSLPADDRFHFTFARGQTLRVLLVRGEGHDGDAELYLRRALGVGDTPPIGVDVASPSALGAGTLAGHALVILHDAPVRGAGGRVLADWVRRGGGLLVALGETSAPEAWEPALAELLPGRPGAVVDRSDVGGAHLASYERTHPALAAFAAPHSGDLALPRVLRRRALTLASDAQVLARFEDGAPALVERPAGKGRVLLWASTLDNWWTDLPLDPVYVPLVRQLATHTARVLPAAPAYLVGQTIDPSSVSDDAAPEWVVESPSGRRQHVGADGIPGLATLAEPGVYRVRPNGSRNDAGVLLAANVDPAEADPTRVPPAEIAAAVGDGSNAPVAAAPAETRAEREARQSLWRYLLIAMLALLVAETVVASRRPRLAR